MISQIGQDSLDFTRLEGLSEFVEALRETPGQRAKNGRIVEMADFRKHPELVMRKWRKIKEK